MTYVRICGRPSWWVAAMALFGMVVVLGLSNTSTAQAEEVHYCWGKTLKPGAGEACYDTAERYMSTIFANGTEGPVCAGIYNGGVGACNNAANEGLVLQNLNGAYGRAYIYAKNTTTKVYGTVYTHTPPYWHTQSLGGTLTSDPDMSGWGSGNLNVFARGTDNAIWRRNWNGSSWSEWSSIGCCLVSGPASVNRDGNKIDVVGRVSGNSIGRWYTTNNGTSWSYENIGGNFISDPAVASREGQLDVFARDSNNYVWQRHWNGTSWGEWKVAFCCVISGLGADYWASRLQVVGLNEGNVVGYYYSDNGGTGWSYENLATSLPFDPDISENRVYASGWASDLWERTASKAWNGANVWGSWNKLPGSISGGPGGYGVHVAGRAADNSITHWWFDF